jgi:hypothetical protein
MVQADGGVPARQCNADGRAGSGATDLTTLTATGASGTFSLHSRGSSVVLALQTTALSLMSLGHYM